MNSMKFIVHTWYTSKQASLTGRVTFRKCFQDVFVLFCNVGLVFPGRYSVIHFLVSVRGQSVFTVTSTVEGHFQTIPSSLFYHCSSGLDCIGTNGLKVPKKQLVVGL